MGKEDKSLKLNITSSPHIHSPITVKTVMWDVILALLPAGFVGIYFFGFKALAVILTCIISALVAEYVAGKVLKIEFCLLDGSACLTGLLLAFCLPPATPLWIAAIGSIVAIIIGKSVFGGLGKNVFNPALIGRAFLLASWPAFMTSWSPTVKFLSKDWFSLSGKIVKGKEIIDAVSMATPLGYFKEQSLTSGAHFFAKVGQGLIDSTGQVHKMGLWDMIVGNIGGCIGETSAVALLIGAIFLLGRGHITWHIPAPTIITVAILGYVFGSDKLFDPQMMFIHLFCGGLFLGAFFMATDMVTTPITPLGRIIFGFGCGFLIFMIRKFSGSYPEGVCYAILIMNAFTPLIDRFTSPRVFGKGAANG
ncbi:RnfABCDGE type electron transport complex subunit D [bacterium]|nr:RnfABCDGE type electron transport complex subunit D [bacterium]